MKQAIASITATSDVGDLGDALRLASALAARSGDAEILVATDAVHGRASHGHARGTGARPPRRTRPGQPGDRGPGRPDRAVRALPFGVRVRGELRHGSRRAAAGGLRGRPAARHPRADAGPPAPDRRLDRRHRRSRPPRLRGRGPARPEGRGLDRGGGHAGRGRPGLGDRPADGTAHGPARERRGPVPRDRALVPAGHRALRRDSRRVRPGHQARAASTWSSSRGSCRPSCRPSRSWPSHRRRRPRWAA